MTIQKYINKNKELHSALLAFLENAEDAENGCRELIHIIKTKKYEKNQNEFEHFLLLVVNIANNHHRNTYFNEKIEKILLFFSQEIKQTFSNFQIFNISQNNKKILLFLIENQILTVDERISRDMINKNFCHFFFPEIKSFIEKDEIATIENSFQEQDLVNFDHKRHIGENDSYICQLIRQDLIEDFVRYVTQTNISLNSCINNSIFETNLFLIEKKNTTLIEYATFFGSIQIFQYLTLNDTHFTSSLWLYSIHSQNAELIHILESNKVRPPNKINAINRNGLQQQKTDSYERCFIESIKCHHNDIADYINYTYLTENINERTTFDESFYSLFFQYHNYSYFPNDINDNSLFFLLCLYNYNKLVKLYLQIHQSEIEETIDQAISKSFLLIMFNKSIFFMNNIPNHNFY